MNLPYASGSPGHYHRLLFLVVKFLGRCAEGFPSYAPSKLSAHPDAADRLARKWLAISRFGLRPEHTLALGRQTLDSLAESGRDSVEVRRAGGQSGSELQLHDRDVHVILRVHGEVNVDLVERSQGFVQLANGLLRLFL